VSGSEHRARLMINMEWIINPLTLKMEFQGGPDCKSGPTTHAMTMTSDEGRSGPTREL
jgi:hypothetical protein